MSSTVYSNGKWKIEKDGDNYDIRKGRKLIDSSDNFEEAYALLWKHRKSI